MLTSPLRTRNITHPFPFEALRKTQEKESSVKIPVKQDPPPQNTWNYKKVTAGLAGMTLGSLGVLYAGKTLYNLIPSWSRITELFSKSADIPGVKSPGWVKVLYSLPGRQALPMLYLGKISYRTILAGFCATKAATEEKKRGRLDLRSIYREIHEQGIQGQGFKVGILDVFSDQKGSKPKIQEKQSFQREFSAFLAMPHGSAVSSVIQATVPKAQLMHFPVLRTSKVLAEMDKVMAEFKEKPEELTFTALRKGLRPAITEMGINLKAAVDAGVNAINVSLGPEQLLDTFVQFEVAEYLKASKRQGLKRFLPGEPDLETLMAESAYFNRLVQLLIRDDDVDERLNPISKELIEIYQPWYDALEYAAKKNVLVVIGSGNNGNAPESAVVEGLSHINPLGLQQPKRHNVMVVGSTNEQGMLSPFSAEYNNKIQPDIAANGSGQINTQGIAPALSHRLAWKNPTAPFWVAQIFQNSPGTSIAAPQITGLYILMQSARKKDGKSLLSMQDYDKVLSLAAQKVTLDPSHKMRHKKSAELQTKWDKADLERELASRLERVRKLQKRADRPGLSTQELQKRLKTCNEISDQYIAPISNQLFDIHAFEMQLSDQLEREEILRKTGPKGTIAGRRLHALSIARQYQTKQETAQTNEEID